MKLLVIRDEDGTLDPVCVDENTGLWYFYTMLG